MKSSITRLALLIALVAITRPVCGQESLTIQALLELDAYVTMNIKSQRIITLCTDGLNDKKAFSESQIVRLLELRAFAYSTLEKYEGAANDYADLIRLRPKKPQYQWEYACALGYQGLTKKAMTELEAVMKKHPDFAPAYASYAIGRFSEGDYKGAEEYASRALALAPTLPHAHYVRAKSRCMQQRFAEALDDIDKCLDLSKVKMPGSHPYYLRALILNKLGRYKNALENLEAASRISEVCPDTLTQVHTAHWGMGNFHAAAHFASELHAVRNSDSDNMLYGFSLIGSGRFDEADKFTAHTLSQQPNFIGAVVMRAVTLAVRGNEAEAAGLFNKVVETSKPDLKALGAASVFLAACSDPKLRNVKKARELATHVSKLDGSDPHFLMTLAHAHAQEGSADEAIKYADQALQLFTEDCTRRNNYKAMRECMKKKQPLSKDLYRFLMLPHFRGTFEYRK